LLQADGATTAAAPRCSWRRDRDGYRWLSGNV